MGSARAGMQPTFWARLDQGDRDGNCQKILLVHLWLTILGLAVRVWLGWSTQSLSLLADALHTLLDAFSAVLSLMALTSPYRFNGRESWTYGSMELGLTLGLTAILGFGALSLSSIAMHQLTLTPTLTALPPLNLNAPMVQVMFCLVIAQTAIAFFQYRSGRQLQSIALKASGLHILQDAWWSIALLVGLVLMTLGYRWIDPMLTMGLVIGLGMSGWRLLRRQLPTLLRPVAIAPEAISQMVRQVQGVTGCNAVRSQGVVGRQVWVEMTVALHPEFMSSQNWVKQQIEALIRDRYGPVQVMIEVENEE